MPVFCARATKSCGIDMFLKEQDKISFGQNTAKTVREIPKTESIQRRTVSPNSQ